VKTRADSVVPSVFPDKQGNPKDPRAEMRLSIISDLGNDTFPTSLGIPIPAPRYPVPLTVEFSILRLATVLDPDPDAD
jgi:hypothetical protein